MAVKIPDACMKCEHYHADQPRTCKAFPREIPDIIWILGDPHTKPITGDQGIQFEETDDGNAGSHRA